MWIKFYIEAANIFSSNLLNTRKAEMKRVAGGDTSVLKQHYEKKVQDLEQEKRNLQVFLAVVLESF